jgi:hypothetical protein
MSFGIKIYILLVEVTFVNLGFISVKTCVCDQQSTRQQTSFVVNKCCIVNAAT